MNLNVGLWQKQTLKLAMTQELTQAIALLQYSAQELTAFLESKALENPLITISDAPFYQKKRRNRSESTKTDWIEQIADQTISSEEQFISQLNFNKLTDRQLQIIKHLLQYLDENGYFRGDLAEIQKRWNVPVVQLEEGLSIIQGLEPAGIGARNLQECMLIQLKRNHPEDELAQKILTDYFVPFAEKKWKFLSKELHISLKELQNIFDRVQQLNPRPGADFSFGQTEYIIPDAIIDVTGEDISVRLWDAAIPKVNFNAPFYTRFSTSQDEQVGKFLQEKVQDFHWIMKSIEQRKETLAKVILKITEKQPDFFLKGPNYLQPMTMKDLAQELGVHESTISRAARGKYVQTPSGTIPLKTFFSSMIQTTSDENTSSSHVKNRISQLIDGENKQSPYSDQEIVELLKKNEGIMVSRRTVAKYRDQLGIPSSPNRKRY